MPGYLLDTNHVSAWQNNDPRLLEHADAENVENLLWVCSLTVGEIESGLLTADPPDEAKQRECRKFLYGTALQFVHEVRVTTGPVYADVLAKILKKHPRHGVKTQKHLTSIGVDVIDLWICAVAIEHNLILLTDDAMATIRACVPELRTDNWLV